MPEEKLYFKIIIAGSRTFNNYALLKRKMDSLLRNKKETDNIEVISGHANGADLLGEMYAKANGYKLTYFEADWDSYGRSAGPVRNKIMAEYASPYGGCVAFWDGTSRGTLSMINLANEYKLKLSVVRF